MSDHTERKPLLHEGPLRLLAKNLMDSVKQKDAEIERLKGDLAEAILIMEQGRECLRQLVSLANVNAETRKMLRYLGNTFNLFLQKHTPPNCPLETGIRPCMCDLPRCPICSYTEHDARFEGDHSRCKGEIPGSTPSLPANWRPRHMDEGDDYVNEPRTGPVSDGPPGQNMESK